MDNLEKYIRDNKGVWDDLKAPSDAWNKIELELDEKTPPKQSLSKWSKFLFLLVGLALISAIIYPKLVQSDIQETDSDQKMQFAEIPDYKETEQFYKNSIDLSLVALQNLGADATLLEDLSQLDEIEKELRAEYKESQGAYKKDILHALIQNHKTKLGLIERVLEELENKQNERDDII